MNKKKADTILYMIFGVIILICVIFIIKDVYDYESAEKEYKELSNGFEYDEKEPGLIKTTVAKDKPGSGPSETYFDMLKRINPDLAGILSVPSLDLRYPVVQGKDNSKYLSYTFEGKKNPAGCLFVDCENDSSFSDGNTYIYGHNMKNGSMFGSLKNMTKEDFDRENARAYILTADKTIGYKFEKAEVVNINEYKAPSNAEGLLTLYTCWGNDKSRRLLVTFSKEEEKRAA